MNISNRLAACRKAGARVVLGALACSMIAASPAQAAPTAGSAEKLRRLDIMLMVTGLRCRTTADNFTTEYGRFTASHMPALKASAAALRKQLAVRYGAAGAPRALDRLSTTMANDYGSGHPWLDCAQLKAVATGLAQAKGPGVLEAAADQLLGPIKPSQFAMAGK
jgi:hypothetical protein